MFKCYDNAVKICFSKKKYFGTSKLRDTYLSNKANSKEKILFSLCVKKGLWQFINYVTIFLPTSLFSDWLH